MGNITTPLKARPTIYKGIEMRSRLEARWAQVFEDMRVGTGNRSVWEYEPFCFANDKGQYLPDFRQKLGDSWIYYEIKPFVNNPIPIMEQMEIILDSEPPNIALELIVGAPDDSKSFSFFCDRYHPMAWYEWNLARRPDEEWHRDVEEPIWFQIFRTDPFAHELFEASEWKMLGDLEESYWSQRSKWA